MPIDYSSIGTQAATGAVGQIIGLALQGHNDRRQIRQQGKLLAQQQAYDKQMAQFNYGQQMALWHETNYSEQMKELKKAGLNPGLIYGMGGGGGATTAAATGNTSAASAPQGGGEIGMGIQTALQLQLLKAQKDNIEADTKKKEVDAHKAAGVDTENVKADTANKILAQVITDYTGKELKDQYERIKAPNRGVEAKTYQDELEARQGVAGTIYELWAEGKLKEKSVAEIEAILLDNANKIQDNEQRRAQTRQIYKQMELLEEQIKGQKLDNIMNDLEAKLQTQTGIDRNSPAWMKILGRLFVTLFNK